MIPQNTESGLVEKQNKTNKQTKQQKNRGRRGKTWVKHWKVLSGNTSHWGCSGSS